MYEIGYSDCISSDILCDLFVHDMIDRNEIYVVDYVINILIRKVYYSFSK